MLSDKLRHLKTFLIPIGQIVKYYVRKANIFHAALRFEIHLRVLDESRVRSREQPNLTNFTSFSGPSK